MTPVHRVRLVLPQRVLTVGTKKATICQAYGHAKLHCFECIRPTRFRLQRCDPSGITYALILQMMDALNGFASMQ